MKTKKTLLLIIAIFTATSMVLIFSSFKTKRQTFKVTCQFSPSTSNFVNLEMENCNNLFVNSSVAAGTTWSPSLIAANCSSIYITTGVPAIHAAGTINIYKNGTLAASHPVAQNQPASFFDVFTATFGDQFLVTW